MHKGALRGLIFDLDGTLVDSLSSTFEAFNEGFRRCGAREHTPQEIMAHFGPGEGEIFARIVGREKAQEAMDAFLEHTQAQVGRAPLHAGVAELLESCKSAGVPVSIVTGRSWETTEMILRHHRVLDRFVTVICHDHVSSSKPSPEGILLACKRMSLDPHQVLYTGDHPVDIRAARSAGSGGVAALWDLLASREHLAAHDPHHWAERPAQVWELWLEHRARSA
jgi:HAD superfamily hydrolase (TIGR01549 family)